MSDHEAAFVLIRIFIIFIVDKIENMRTLTISVSELEYEKYDLKSDDLSFSELVDLISRELSRQNLKKTVVLSEQHGLSKMTMEDITREIKAVREDAAHS